MALAWAWSEASPGVTDYDWAVGGGVLGAVAVVAFRPILIIPQAIAVWALGLAWCLATVFAWFAILFTGAYPAGRYRFGASVLQWTTRVEAYMLLLHDDYPPFTLDPA